MGKQALLAGQGQLLGREASICIKTTCDFFANRSEIQGSDCREAQHICFGMTAHTAWQEIRVSDPVSQSLPARIICACNLNSIAKCH